MAHNHHRHFVHKPTQPLPDLEFRYRKALPHGFSSFQPPPKRVPAAWKAVGGEPSEFDNPPQPLYQPDRYRSGMIPRKVETARGEEIHAKLDYLLAAFDKWDATDRRIGRLYTPPRPESAPYGGEHRSAGQPWRDPSPLQLADRPTPPRDPYARYRGSFHDQPRPQTIANNWDQVEWDDRRDHRHRQGFEEYPRRHQHLHNGRAEQPTYRSTQSDRLLSHGTTPLPADAPPRSGFTRQPQQPSKCIDLGRQRDLPNTPNHMVRSPCPAQSVTVSDYNEKLRIYRLELNAWFEENIDDEDLVEDVPNNAAHNGGVNLDVDVPINESREEIVKTDNMPLQVLVGVCDEKIGDLIVPTHREVVLLDDVGEDNSTKEMKMVVASLNEVQVSSKNVVGNCWGKKESGAYTGLPVIACVYMGFNVGNVPSMNHLSTSLDTDARLIPPRNDTPCLSILRGVDKLFVLSWSFADNIGSPLFISDRGDKGRRSAVRCVFDPGGDKSPKLLLSTLAVSSCLSP